MANGNWWLLLKRNRVKIGYWPQWLFTDLAGFATNVDWGGVAYSPAFVPEPPMGSGDFPIGKVSSDAYLRVLQVVNVKGEIIDVDTFTRHVDDINLYKILDLPHASGNRHVVFYGGPGDKHQ